MRFVLRTSMSVCRTDFPGSSLIPMTPAAVCGTSDGSARGASSTSQTPSPLLSKISAAACRASRVLPLPPEPVRVKRRDFSNSALTSESSVSRPMKLVICCGRLLRMLSSERSGGKSAGRS